jgi:hypothetical protein
MCMCTCYNKSSAFCHTELHLLSKAWVGEGGGAEGGQAGLLVVLDPVQGLCVCVGVGVCVGVI